MFAWSDFFELNRVPACCKDDLNLLELRILVLCRASLWKLHMDLWKVIFEAKINCFAFSEPPKHHFVCKTTKKRATTSQTELLPPTPFSAVVMASTKIRTISERFPSASEDSFKVASEGVGAVVKISASQSWGPQFNSRPGRGLNIWVTFFPTKVHSAFHPYGVGKMSTSIHGLIWSGCHLRLYMLPVRWG